MRRKAVTARRRRVLLPPSARLLMLVWLVVVMAPLATVGVSALVHAVLYLAPALVFLLPLCLNRDPAGELLVRLTRRPARLTAATGRERRGVLVTMFHAVVWRPRGGLLIAMAHAGRAPPRPRVPAVAPL